jgi:hypothetical protein
MNDVISKEELFVRLGYGGSHDLLESALEEAGLSRANRKHVANAKAAEIAAVLEERFVIVCSRGDCRKAIDEASDGRTLVTAASQTDCVVCAGSANARAVDEMVGVMENAGFARLCVVGGSPNTRLELERLVSGRVELRLIDGAVSRSMREAKADLAWADLVILWGSTILDHKVSRLYKGPKVVQMARRGIRELAREVARAANQ